MVRKRASRVLSALVLALAFGIAGKAALAQHSKIPPYSGQETRDIKSLSSEDIEQLLAGRGWGFAKPAELNSYPGPAHLLELADQLRLSRNQRSRIQEVYERMNDAARHLGTQFVEAERALSLAFASRQIEHDQLARLVHESGRIRSELRLVHLTAHLDVLPLLSQHQVMIYKRLRGYGGAHDHWGAIRCRTADMSPLG